MYPSLLVPLDRSSFAEKALPLALSIVRRGNGRLDLVEVHATYALHDPHAGWLAFQSELDDECKKQEQLYLDATAKWATILSTVSADTGVLSGSAVLPATVAKSILERAHTGKADLIVMATRGRGPLSCCRRSAAWLKNWSAGAPIPILLVRPDDKAPEIILEPILDNILILLDGSALAERVLEPAMNLARLMEASCTLLRVIKPRSSSEARGRDNQPEAEPAATYLERIAERLREPGLEVRTRVVVARHVAKAILEEAETQGGDLIALATHGRGGLKRFLLGSVADKLIQAGTAAVLICGPTGKDN